MNFGCPIRFAEGGCGSPLLVYHHFDPPWQGNYVHNPDGMIALCPEHHAQADAGLWTQAQLRDFKRNPYVDDRLRVQWPWTPETLVARAGQTLVIGGGSPLRMGGRPVIAFRPVEIEALGTKTIEFDSDIRDAAGEAWLRIENSYFDLRLERITDVKFLPSTREVHIRRNDQSRMKLRLDRHTLEEFSDVMRSVGMKQELLAGALASVEQSGGIDSEGRIPVLTLTGRFISKYADATITDEKFELQTFIKGYEHERVEIPFVVSQENALSLRQSGGAEFVRIG